MNYGVVLGLLDQHNLALNTHLDAVRLKHQIEVNKNNQNNNNDDKPYHAKILPRPTDGTPICVIYCNEYGQTWWPKWGPRSIDNGGVGGSEESVIFIARSLVKLGWYVEVYTDPPEIDYGLNSTHSYGVLWYPLHYYQYVTKTKIIRAKNNNHNLIVENVFIAWRYHISLGLAPPKKYTKSYLWLQDMPSGSISKQLASNYEFISNIHRILCLSKFHLYELPIYGTNPRKKAIVTPNALNNKYFVSGQNKNNIFIYASAPNRGLREVLISWNKIFTNVQNAKLYVYYGFTNKFIAWGKQHMSNFDTWLINIKKLLNQPGVYYIGLVDHITLANAYASSGFTLYPTSYPETGCVSLMKAQALGSIPITSRMVGSTLPELTGLWDMGPINPHASDSSDSSESLNDRDGILSLPQKQKITISQDKNWLRFNNHCTQYVKAGNTIKS